MEKIPKQEKSDIESNKQKIWEEQASLFKGIGEGDLPIDNEELLETLVALNVTGIHTLASNAGHAVQERHTGDTAYPWILFTTEQDAPGTSGYEKLQDLLVDFYKDRNVSTDVKLRVGDIFHSQFTLMNVDEGIQNKDHDGAVTEEEKRSLVEKLPERQKEMYDFGQFLKSRFFAN